MTQKSVEILIGKLVSDEELRNRFRRDRRSTLEALRLEGLEFSPVEIAALQTLDATELEAHSLDPRLQKVTLKHVSDNKE